MQVRRELWDRVLGVMCLLRANMFGAYYQPAVNRMAMTSILLVSCLT